MAYEKAESIKTIADKQALTNESWAKKQQTKAGGEADGAVDGQQNKYRKYLTIRAARERQLFFED